MCYKKYSEYTPATVTRSDHFNIEKKICNEIDGDISLLARSPTLKLTLIHCVFFRRLGLMPVSSSPKESLCLGRSVRTLQKEPPPSASSWMTFHWYEAADKVSNNDHVMFSVGFLTLRNNCIVFFQTHLTFGKEFTEAVEMKQVAQQEAERARFVVEKVFILMLKSSLSSTCTFRKYM